MDGVVQEYFTSKGEMKRRKDVFAKMTISFFITICLLSFSYIIELPQIVVPLLMAFITVIILLIILVNHILNKQSNYRVYLSEKEIERKFGNASKKYLIKDIKSIRIKRTTKGLIREIRFRMSGTEMFHINGLDEFEKFNEEIFQVIKEDTQVDYFKEPPIDFDHPMYYVFFGPVLGVISTLFFRLLLAVGENNIGYIQLIIACYIIFVGMFYIIGKPTRSRYGDKNKKTDYIFGAVFLVLGILFILLNI